MFRRSNFAFPAQYIESIVYKEKLKCFYYRCDTKAEKDKTMSRKTGIATLGGGCFWCLEAVFERVDGVVAVTSGYAGGTVSDPSYEEVCEEKTGHAEVVRIEFDTGRISYEDILDLFWKAHDPTTPNRQQADVGTQYRSIILYHNEEQKTAAEESMRRAEALYENPIVTEILPYDRFFPAEGYHQDYFEKNRNAGYCRIVIQPKLKKLGLG